MRLLPMRRSGTYTWNALEIHMLSLLCGVLDLGLPCRWCSVPGEQHVLPFIRLPFMGRL